MDYCQATDNDLQGMLDLQNKNLIQHLTDSQKEDGFLSVAFTREQFKVMNEQTGVMVCKEGDRVCGYMCASSLEFNQAFPLVATMIETFPALTYKGKPLDQYSSVIIGPWCIATDCRGRGVFVNLWLALNKLLMHKADLVIAFISVHNLRSYHAAKKVGMCEISTFQFNESDFFLLIKALN
jgi:hypothetical protein